MHIFQTHSLQVYPKFCTISFDDVDLIASRLADVNKETC